MIKYETVSINDKTQNIKATFDDSDIVLICKSGVEKRISYIIFDGKIYSSILNWKPRKYTGANKHNCHAHFSFKATADNDGAFFQVPMLGASDE
jgi:hypothetical protein